MKWLCAAAAFYAALGLAVWQWVRLPETAPLDAAERSRMIDALRRGASSGGASAGGPLMIQLYHQGRVTLRLQAASLDEAAQKFAAAGRPPGRLMIHLLHSKAPLPTPLLDRWPLLFALSLVPGVDGLSLEVGGRETVLLPDDLLRAGALGGAHPLPQLELDVGVDVGRVMSLAFDRMGIDSGRYESTPHRWRRVRVESFAEPEKPEEMDDAAPAVTREALLGAARAAGDYLVRHLGDDGRYDYVYDPLGDRSEADEYSLTRHAGSTWFLAQLLGATRQDGLGEPIRRALGFLQARSRARGSIGEGRVVDLGSAALSLLAAAEYQHASGDARFQAWMGELAGFLLYMQLPDGDFRHFYRPDGDVVEGGRAPYYSGEAALALARYATVVVDPRYAAAAERALDFLTGPYYDFFLGQFVYAEDHWTCLAADALPTLPSGEAGLRRYAAFCDGFAAFLRRMQYTPDEELTRVRPEYAGAYGIGPILPPHNIPAGSRTECALAVYRLDRRTGRPTHEVRRQVLLSLQFLLARQLDDRRLWRLPNPERARGGIPQSDVNWSVRIDGVQHVGSALLRGADLLSMID
jgi:hypothetical protein